MDVNAGHQLVVQEATGKQQLREGLKKVLAAS